MKAPLRGFEPHSMMQVAPRRQLAHLQEHRKHDADQTGQTDMQLFRKILGIIVREIQSKGFLGLAVTYSPTP